MGQGSVKVRRQLCPERQRGRVTHGAAGKVSRVSRLLGVKCMNIIFADLVMAYCNSPSDLGYVQKPCQVKSKSKKSMYQVLKVVLPPSVILNWSSVNSMLSGDPYFFVSVKRTLTILVSFKIWYNPKFKLFNKSNLPKNWVKLSIYFVGKQTFKFMQNKILK